MKFGMPELKELISIGAGISLEFLPHLDDYNVVTRTLVAFANTNGGTLIVGVKENGKIIGVNPQEELHSLEEAIREFSNPPVSITSKVLQEGRHLALEIQVSKSNIKHKAKDGENKWSFYQRIDKHTLVGNKITIQLWKLQDQGNAKPDSFDDRTSEIIDLIKTYQPVTISKLFRLSSIEKNNVIEIVASLTYWDIVDCHMNDSSVEYTLHE